MDHNSLYDASPRGSTKSSYTNLKQLMLDGGVNKARERRDYHNASTSPGKTNGHLEDGSEIGERVKTTPQQERTTVRRIQSRHGEIVAPAESAPSPVKSKPTAAKDSRSRAKTNRSRVVISPIADASNEKDDFFNIPVSPDQPKTTKSANERAPKGPKATKPRARPAVYSAKVAGRTSATSTAKLQAKEVRRPPQSIKPPKVDEIDANEGFELDRYQDELAAVRKSKKAKPTPSKPTSAVADRKKNNTENHNSLVSAEAGSAKKKKSPNSKTVAANHHSSSVAPATTKAELSKKLKTPGSKAVAAKYQSSPVALNQPQNRRAAAVKANNRIQGIQDEDVDLSAEALQPESATDGPSSDSYAARGADYRQAKLRANEHSDLMKSSPFAEVAFQKPDQNEIHINEVTADHLNDAAPGVRAVGSPKVHPSEAFGLPEGVALLRHLNEDTPTPTIESGQLDRQLASAVGSSSEKENRKATTRDENLEQPIDHYFNDALAYSDEDTYHKLGSVEKEIPLQEADSFNDALNDEPLVDQKRRTRGSNFQNRPNGLSTNTRNSIASKLREALSGVLNTSLEVEGLFKSKNSLPRASAKFQPRMTEATPDEVTKRTKPSRRTKPQKPLITANEDKKEKIVGRVGEPNRRSPEYVALENLTGSKTPKPAETARALGPSQAALNVFESNANHIEAGDSDIINISSGGSELSEYFSDEAAEDDVRFAVRNQSEFSPTIPVAPVVVMAKPKQFTAVYTTAALEAGAIPETAEAQVASRTGKRKSRGQDDEVGVTKKLKAQLPMKITTLPQMADTDMAREGPPTPLIDDYLHRKSTLISFSANGPRNQGIVFTQKPRASMMASNDPERQNNLQKEALMKRKRDEDTSAAAGLVETPEEKRRRRSRARNSTGTSGFDMVDTAQRLSSQGRRVDANGSPRPLVGNPRKSNEWTHGILKSFQEFDDCVIAPVENAADRTEAYRFAFEDKDLPMLSTGSIPDEDEDWIFPSIRKQLPSSPNAPSQILADLTAHTVQPGGRFVNVETDSIVKPSLPQDPFTGNIRRRPSSFMERLRAQGKVAEKSRSKGTDEKDPTQGTETVLTLAADPDKTLVAAGSGYPSSPGLRPDTSSESSDSLNSSSHKQSDGGGSEDDAARQWREALQPHQSSQLDILYDISNVSG